MSYPADLESNKAIAFMISSGQWKKFQKYLLKRIRVNNDSSNCNVKYYSKCEQHLHFACRFHPPLSIVQSLVKAFPGVEKKRDFMNRCPLHVALLHGVSADVAEYLINIYPEAASLQDNEGKTPLHLAFDNYKSRSNPGIEHGNKIKNSILDIVPKLCQVSPSVLTIEEINGMNVLEYAIEEEVDLEIVKALQRALIKCSLHKGQTVEATRDFELKISKIDRKFACVFKAFTRKHYFKRKRRSSVRAA